MKFVDAASGRVLRHFLAPLVLVALAALMIAHHARADIASPWGVLLDEQRGGLVHFGVKLGGSAPFERNADEAFVPASITKLFTAGVALEKLGPDYRFETTVEWQVLSGASQERIAGLAITGSGDPSWGVAQLQSGLRARLNDIAALLFKAGVREIHGPIRFVSKDARWDDGRAPQGWAAADLLTCDGALPHAFNIALNCATLVITDSQHAHWREEGVPTPIHLDLSVGEKTSVHVEFGDSGYRLGGTMSADAEPKTLYLPIADTAGWAQGLLMAALKDAGIQALDSQPGDESFVEAQKATLQSLPLRDILKPFLKNSINLIGQDLYLASGGTSVSLAYLKAHLPSDQAAVVVLHDGCGMSFSNQVTPSAVYALLEELVKSADFGVIWDALPVAGVDGTLAGRMQGTAAEGVVRAKTGTLSGDYNLAGYVPTYNAIGQAVAFAPFVVLAHTTAALESAAHAAQDRVAEKLAADAHKN